jgi:hypothetical protein
MPAAEADLLTENTATKVNNLLTNSTSASRVFGDASTLKIMLSYLGPGHWFVIGAVSSLWRETYYADSMELLEFVQALPSTLGNWSSKRYHKGTLYSAALASPVLLRLAFIDGGLACTSHKFAEAAIKQADFPTLTAAVELGMRLSHEQTSTLSKMAAAQQSLPMLQWLSALPQCKLADDIDLYAAAWGGSIEVLSWLKQQVVDFTEQTYVHSC